MSADKYPSVFLRQIEVIAYLLCGKFNFIARYLTRDINLKMALLRCALKGVLEF